MSSLSDTVLFWNNLQRDELVEQWKFLIAESNEPIGYISNSFVNLLCWREVNWQIHSAKKVIRLVPRVTTGRREFVKACNQALVEFCVDDQHIKPFSEPLQPWLAKLESNGTKSIFHPVLTSRSDLEGLVMPSAARGIFGIMTAGVHLNAYASKPGPNGREEVDKIWVSRRSQTTTYPGLLDQIVAGGMDPTDGVDPATTLRHEALEEAMWKRTDTIVKEQSLYHADFSAMNVREIVGDVQDAGRIYFCMRKDASAGAREDGHIEPGVRFCYDLKLAEGVEPVPNDGEAAIAKFLSLSVEEVIASLEARQWKPNSGLVMLDFLYRRGLVDEATCAGIRSLKQKPPLSLPEFSHSEMGS